MSTAKLRQFITQNDDFGFEMRVGAVIAKSGATDLWHGATYTDPKTTLARQFDYRFQILDNLRCVAFATECKNINPDSPVVICGRKRAKKEAYHDLIVSHGGKVFHDRPREGNAGLRRRGIRRQERAPPGVPRQIEPEGSE